MSLTPHRVRELEVLSNQFRIDVLSTIHRAQSGHPGGSLSVCEILTTLYFEIASLDPLNPNWAERDRIILSKGHAAPMLYRILAEKGYFPLQELDSLRRLNARLQGHPSAKTTPGVEIPTGPLGLGLSASVGMALGLRAQGIDAHIYTVLGDGELDEGSNWEACMTASKYDLNRLIAIVDHNGMQLDGSTDTIMPLRDLQTKFAAFGWRVLVCHGHSVGDLCETIQFAATRENTPTAIIAKTTKGKGVSFMENTHLWHGKPISDTDLANALAELGGVANGN